jgi:hypothetical protein
MSTGMKYFSLFLPTSRDIPPEKSWKLWLPEFNMFWSTWSNSPAWEVDLLKLYNRLAFHQVSVLVHLEAGATHQLGRWTCSSFTTGLLSIRFVSIAACMPEVLQHVLLHLEQFASLGGGPTQALHQACLPSG